MKNNDITTALLIALQTPAPKGSMGIPVLLWGKPGQGKSSFLEGLAKDDFPVQTLIASIHDPTDFSGLPIHLDGKVHYAAPEWIGLFGQDGEGLLLLDELTTAPPSVQAALLRLVLERKVGFHPLPLKVRIVSAANPPDMITGGWDLTAPLLNRFVHLEWSLSAEAFLKGMQQGFPRPALPEIPEIKHSRALKIWKARLQAFLKLSPHLLNTSIEEEGQYAFASPRTWEFAVTLMASCDVLGIDPVKGKNGTNASLKLLEGCVGKGAALAFYGFVKKLRLPDPQKLLTGELKFSVNNLNDGELFVLFEALADTLIHYNGKELPRMTLQYLNLTEQVFQNGCLDVIYASLRMALKESFLVKALMESRQEDSNLNSLIEERIQTVFSNAGIVEYVEIFD